MKNESVCKFNVTRSSDLICVNFIREARRAQKSGVLAKHHAIHLVMAGEGVFLHGEKEYAISRGTLFFVREGDRFAVSGSDALVYCYISFFGRRAEELMVRFGIGEGCGVFHGCECLIPFWEDCQREAEDANIDILCESVLLYSLAKLPPAQIARASAVSQIVSITQERFTENALSLPLIAKQIGYDAKYLSSLFKKKKGIAYTQYLRELRLRHAIFLMEQGVVSVKNIAILSGFGDALYFSKIFSQSIGVSPKTYIANLQM